MTHEVRLETERLVMRMFREDDIESYARIFGDPEVARYLGHGKPLDRWEARRSLVFHVGHWSVRGYGMWAVEEKASGALVGRVGFYYPEDWPGTELEREHLISAIFPDNVASIRVAERLGERLERRTTLLGREALIYGIDHATWKS